MKYISLITFLVIVPNFALAQATNGTNEQNSTEESENNEPHFPVLTLNGGLGLMSRHDSAGVVGGGGFDFQSDWAYVGLNVNIGALGNSPNDWLFTEVSGYGHLLAIGVSDITYRRYLDGDELRLLAGFSYTRSHEDIVRVDVNLGVDYFDESLNNVNLQEWGIQVGARIRAKFWRFENFLQVSVYQNLEVGTGEIDLSGTEIVCDNFDEVLAGGDLMCEVPPRDPEAESGGGGLVNWQTTGFLIQERLFLNVHDEADGGRWGPEAEIRLERTPLRDFNFWVMLSFRYYWSAMEI